MDLQKEFGRNDDAIQDGNWVQFGDAWLKILYAKSPKVMEAADAKQSEAMARKGGFKWAKTDAISIAQEILAEHIIVDWRGLKEDGVELTYSKENAKKIVSEYPEFADAIADASRDLSYFRELRVAKTVKK